MLALLTLDHPPPHAEGREKFPGGHFYLLAIIVPAPRPLQKLNFCPGFRALAHAHFESSRRLDRQIVGLPKVYSGLIIS
jgi:hypothetical protein